VLDISDIQNRVPSPKVREIARLAWPEVSVPQNNIPVTIAGRRFLIEFDEYDSNVFSNDPSDVVGAVHIIDIDDETKPQMVGRIRLEVHQQEARATDQQQDPGNLRPGQGYAAHYCSVPKEVEPGILACSMIASGLRIFDIRDPKQPRELAYFNQPLVAGLDPSEAGAYAMSAPAFAPERAEVWYADSNTGFFDLRLTGEAAALLRGSPSPDAGAPPIVQGARLAAPVAPPPPATLAATGATSTGASAGCVALAAALALRYRRRRLSPMC
jgi:hypothetical protein